LGGLDSASGRTFGPTRISNGEFQTFWEAGKRYAELTKNDELIHRNVAVAINGLAELLSAERKRVPETVISNAHRLECMLFNGYDPHFEGDEPPGL
jgi:hypothetical protein